MEAIKRFIVWVNYGLEGWSMYGSSNDWKEALSLRLDAIEGGGNDKGDVFVTESKEALVAETELTEWHRELEAVLMALDDCQLECDGMTWAVSHLLKAAGIPHDCMSGMVRNEQTKDIVTPHYWIALNGGWVVDLRLRMWFGDHDEVPHGIFHSLSEQGFFYQGEFVQQHQGMRLSRAVLDMMTDGKISHVKIPSLQSGEK